MAEVKEVGKNIPETSLTAEQIYNVVKSYYEIKEYAEKENLTDFNLYKLVLENFDSIFENRMFFIYKDKTVDEIKEMIFNREFEKWVLETGVHSQTDLILGNEHYKNIVKMGVDAAPFILKKLINKEAFFLVCALDEIFPGVMSYEGYVPIEDAINTWIIALTAVLNGNAELPGEDAKE